MEGLGEESKSGWVSGGKQEWRGSEWRGCYVLWVRLGCVVEEDKSGWG